MDCNSVCIKSSMKHFTICKYHICMLIIYEQPDNSDWTVSNDFPLISGT